MAAEAYASLQQWDKLNKIVPLLSGTNKPLWESIVAVQNHSSPQPYISLIRKEIFEQQSKDVIKLQMLTELEEI